MNEHLARDEASFARRYKPIIDPLENIAKSNTTPTPPAFSTPKKNVNNAASTVKKVNPKQSKKKRKIFDVSALSAPHSFYPNKRLTADVSNVNVNVNDNVNDNINVNNANVEDADVDVDVDVGPASDYCGDETDGSNTTISNPDFNDSSMDTFN